MVMVCVLDTKPGAVVSDRTGATVAAGDPCSLADHGVTARGSRRCSSTSTAPSSTPSPSTARASQAWFAARGWAYDDDVAAPFTGRRADDVFRTVDGPWSGGDPRRAVRRDRRAVPRDRLPEPVAGAAEAHRASAAARGHPAGARHLGRTRRGPPGRSRRSVGSTPSTRTVTRDDIELGKPDPACYALACERLGVDAGARRSRARTPRTGCARPSGAGVGTVVGVTTSFAAEPSCGAPVRTAPSPTSRPARPASR